MSSWRSKLPTVTQVQYFLKGIVHEQEVDYSRFETRLDGSDVITFKENDKAFRLFGTNVHVKVGSYIACAIGFAVTIAFCVSYSLFHSRGQGRNPFIDHLEIIDLIFAFLVGLPCHVLLFYGLQKSKKVFFSPFLVFYMTNFILNCIFTILTLGAFAMDVHRRVFGNIRFDLGWTLFQIAFTAAQGLAIYVVMRGRNFEFFQNGVKRNFRTINHFNKNFLFFQSNQLQRSSQCLEIDYFCIISFDYRKEV
ncbi:hypothetical protein B9Z55_002991 [Caenorhabditis nigoni]|uniref:Uncharacterized protein n=1 Tax=Caenorhabditis nigoni TaxID=1611254 RepID=A0A2G5VN31_9PELO|nr:hypothetical protein B9Z55_002991 [Caenorhabditis nigoni]